jgi:hypothetical protein
MQPLPPAMAAAQEKMIEALGGGSPRPSRPTPMSRGAISSA